MTLNQLRYFSTIARTGSMGQAAKLLYLSQPSLSVSMSRLEEELDVTLFDRIGHRIRLTPEGEVFLASAEKILSDVEEAQNRMRLLSRSHDRLLRLGCIEPAFNHYVPYIMRQFLNIPENADTQFELSADITSELVKHLQEGTLDLLISSASESPEVIQTPLYTMPLALLAPVKDNERAQSPASPVTWEQIAGLPLIGYSQDSSMDHLLSRVAADEHVTLHYVFRAPNEEAITALVYHGFGCSVVPMTETLASSKEVSLFLLPGNYYQTIYLTRLKDRHYRGAAARFIAFMENATEDARSGDEK